MRVIIKKWGNSAGMVIPNVVMKELDLKLGQSMEAHVTNNQLVLTPVCKGYSLEALLAQCDPTAPEVSEQDIWGNSDPVGDEVW
ncbi:AbrB/MazE/SpoVT family DNA-binding domain-containing protein [Citrobacter freundii]|uniref:AbrB/MazE/SpoVT family DNA-binding domain-containing protein n=1 Tax=Citrobacter freundii TaxID=546 RepID=UPI001A1CC957|nr:AbrB/MazE/SpoVT family DNA-binding domain-containing protein [Citrobacter freundii]HAT3773228.1 AbrB/MazE/SpoVT family DNA-binding domain-containing protein [Citrobacter freundii]HCJ7723744.1 AbrB/MazE/SpoVT family DNA-binding domain-containing protein [Citrobacter freundii]